MNTACLQECRMTYNRWFYIMHAPCLYISHSGAFVTWGTVTALAYSCLTAATMALSLSSKCIL